MKGTNYKYLELGDFSDIKTGYLITGIDSEEPILFHLTDGNIDNDDFLHECTINDLINEARSICNIGPLIWVDTFGLVNPEISLYCGYLKDDSEDFSTYNDEYSDDESPFNDYFPEEKEELQSFAEYFAEH